MIKKIYLIEISELFLCSSNILPLSSKPLHSSFFPLLNKFMVSRIAGFFDETDANYLSHFKITCSHNETRPQNYSNLLNVVYGFHCRFMKNATGT